MSSTVGYNGTGPRAGCPRSFTVLAGGSVAGASVQGGSMQGLIHRVLRGIYECTRGLGQWLRGLGPSAGVYRTVGRGPVAGVLYSPRGVCEWVY